MSLLNNLAYTVTKDRLVYDSRHPLDAKAVQIMIEADADGILKRGQLIDFDNAAYSVHSVSGEPCAIVAEDVVYASGDTDVIAAVYTSGSFRASEVISEPEITVADMEVLRNKGIYLK